MSWGDTLVKWFTSEAVIGGIAKGAAVGALGYMSMKEEQKAKKKAYERKLRDDDERRKASSVPIQEYEQNLTNLSGGLLAPVPPVQGG